LRHRSLPPGETFVWYVAGYAVFRFLVEFVRGNEIAWLGLTRPQLFLLATIPLIFARIAWQARRGAYRDAMVPTRRDASSSGSSGQAGSTTEGSPEAANR
jgi:prolipoprotein diacylglyceryltransferase